MVRLRLLSFSTVLVFVLTLFAARAASADTLAGHVIDPQRRAVAGATVIVMRGSRVAATLQTGRDGRFGPVTLAPGAYDVTVAASGLRAAPQSVTVTATSTGNIEIALALAAVGESIVVSASHVDTPLSRVTDSVTVVDRRMLDALQITNVSDAVRLAPGFNVVLSGGPGALTSFFPRGGESDYTQVLVDGVPQNAFGGGFDAAHLPAIDAERIEIVRGPQSALYGGGAIGGLVQVITRHGGPLRGTASVESGSYGTNAFAAAGAGSHAAWSWGGSIDWLSSDGDTRERANLGRRVANADDDRTQASGSLSWSDRADRRIRVDVRGGRNEHGTPGPYGSDPAHFFSGLDLISRGINKTRSVGISGVFGQGRAITQRVQSTWARYSGHFLSPFGPSDDDTTRATGRYQVDLGYQRVGLSGGAEFLTERDDNTFITDAASSEVPVKRNVMGLFIEARPAISSQVLMNAGVRLERIVRTALPADAFGSRPALADDVVWSANPKIAVAYLPNSTSKIRASAGTGIKPPTAFEIGFTNNPNLKPERNRSFDAGIEQSLAGGAVAADATWFRNTYDDLIVLVKADYQTQSKYRTDNISNARAQGVEVGLNWRTARGFSARFGWTYLRTRILAVDGPTNLVPAPYTVGSPLVRRPRQHGSIDLLWSDERTSAFVSISGRGRMVDFEPNIATATFEASRYATTTIGGAVNLLGTLEIYGRITNLFDRDYEEALGYPALGRSAMIGLRVARGH